MIKQNKCMAELEKELIRVKKNSRGQAENIYELQVKFDELEQYSRKNSLEFHGIPNDILTFLQMKTSERYW